MKNTLAYIRSQMIGGIYKAVLKPIFFKQDPEDVHDRMAALGARLGKFALTRSLANAAFSYSDRHLEQTILGIKFKNPIGLAAGFDKNAELTNILPSVGFGFAEVGSITGYPCEGNPKPRLWRLPKSEGLVVYYGLKNDGSEAISGRLRDKKFRCVLGTSVAMTNCAENLEIGAAIKDFEKAFSAFTDIGDYFTINISCPNAEGGQTFIDPVKLEALLHAIDLIATKKPIFIKLSPDMSIEAVDAVVNVAKKHRVQGIICVNLTKKRNNPLIIDADVPAKGGVSGKPVRQLSDDLLSHIYRRENGRFVLVGCGGVFSAEDAYHKIRNGASLVQLITGMIFVGPQLIGEINRGLVKLLERDGFKNISEAIGVDA